MNVGFSADGSYIRASALSGFADLVRSKGGDAVDLLVRAGIDPASLTCPDMLVSFSRQGHLLEVAAAELDMPSFGLEWALNIPPYHPNSGPLLLLNTATIGEWIDKSTRYWRLQTNGQIPTLVDTEDPDRVAIRMAARSGPPPRQQMEHILAKLYRVMSVMVGPDTAFRAQARFQHPKPDDTSVHEQVFGTDVEFDAEHNELMFDRAALSLPISDALPSPTTVVSQFIRHRIRDMPRYNQGVRTTTEIAIRTILGSGMCTKEYVAQVLGLSTGRLQYLLARESTSFGDILEGVRQDIAYRLLSETSIPAATIAGLLDYASAPALTVAMKRWTGMTPSAYRAREKGVDDIGRQSDGDE